jgi:hypothetical protein
MSTQIRVCDLRKEVRALGTCGIARSQKRPPSSPGSQKDLTRLFTKARSKNWAGRANQMFRVARAASSRLFGSHRDGRPPLVRPSGASRVPTAMVWWVKEIGA